ncbi:helix-turn-helix domain-containing protein [Sporichthya polymorpha]|uniref:helix-turn-helix domain-containing protein n=1 Tax=Sporichthya polymorpha TaxID=35751 RepID=UPI0009FFC160|nr:helix-turn-helix domain-containing protein [Sporichthya polymorpha]
MTAAQSHASTSGQRAVIPRQRDKLLLTAEEVAHALGIGRTKVYELMASGRLGSVTIGRLRRVPVTHLDDFVNNLGSEES